MIIDCPSCGFKLYSDVINCPNCGVELGLAGMSDLEDLVKKIQTAKGPEDLTKADEAKQDTEMSGVAQDDQRSASQTNGEEATISEELDEVPPNDPDENDEQSPKRRFRLFGR